KHERLSTIQQTLAIAAKEAGQMRLAADVGQQRVASGGPPGSVVASLSSHADTLASLGEVDGAGTAPAPADAMFAQSGFLSSTPMRPIYEGDSATVKSLIAEKEGRLDEAERYGREALAKYVEADNPAARGMLRSLGIASSGPDVLRTRARTRLARVLM